MKIRLIMMNSNDEKHFEKLLLIFVEIMFIQNEIYSFIAFFEKLF